MIKQDFWTTYPPPLVNVVCERPLRRESPVMLSKGLHNPIDTRPYFAAQRSRIRTRVDASNCLILCYKPWLFVFGTLSESDMRASSALVLSLLFLLCSQRHLASAILPPFAIAAVEAMWGKWIITF